MDSGTRRETVNALAVRAKTDRAAIPELWCMVEDLVKMICGRYCRIPERARLYEDADLYQTAFLGFMKAIDKFDENKGSFSTLLSLHTRSSCRTEIKKYRPESDPMNAAVSLDEPLADTEDFTLADALPDPNALEFIEEISTRSVAQVILDEADKLTNPLHARIIRECLHQGRTLESLANEQGVTRAAISDAQRRAILQLRHRSVVRTLLASSL